MSQTRLTELNLQIAEEEEAVAKARQAVVAASDGLLRSGPTNEDLRARLRVAGVSLSESEGLLNALEIARAAVIAHLNSDAYAQRQVDRKEAAREAIIAHKGLPKLGRDADKAVLALIASLEALALGRSAATQATRKYLDLTNLDTDQLLLQGVRLIQISSSQSFSVGFALWMVAQASGLNFHGVLEFDSIALGSKQDSIDQAVQSNSNRVARLINHIEDFHK